MELAAVGFRGEACALAEASGKVALVGEAGFERNHGDGAWGGVEEATGFLDAQGAEVFGGGTAEQLLKAAIEVGGGEASEFGHVLHGEGFVEVLFHVADRGVEFAKGAGLFFRVLDGVHDAGDAKDVVACVKERRFGGDVPMRAKAWMEDEPELAWDGFARGHDALIFGDIGLCEDGR